MDPAAVQLLIEEFLNRLTVTYDRVELVTTSPLHFLIQSEDSRMLIGNNGTGLDALNFLLRQLARRRFGADVPAAFIVDVNRYRARRIEELIRSAETFASRARLFKRDVEMPPAPSFDRMLVHAHFADDPDILTESYGEGQFRRIILKHRTLSV